jgi:hypothetical protein
VNIDLLDQLQRIAGDLSSEQAAVWLQQIEELRGALEVNINRKIASDALLLSMSEPGRTQGPYARWKP